MNKQILIAMDWKNRSKEELKENYHSAAANADVDVAADAVCVAAAYAAEAEYWINKYFINTGENRKDYEKALEDMRK